MQQARVLIATCEDLPLLVEDDRLVIPELRRLGIEAETAIWTRADVDWKAADAVFIRSTWDYYERAEAFRAWLEGLERVSVRVLNPVSVMLGNIDKIYLRELEARGVPTVPTHWIERGDLRPVHELLAGMPAEWDELVVKPSVSAGAFRTRRLSRAALLADESFLHEVARDAHVLIQPFLLEIITTGEWSFIYFGEELSHAVVKQAKAGDFRVQWTHGGRHERRAAPASLLQQIETIFDLLPEPKARLYTRIDGVVRDGRFMLVEVELIEPYLFLAEEPRAPARLAAALARLLT